MKKIAIIFGGSGFIGSHYTKYLLETDSFSKVIIADLLPPDFKFDKEFFNRMIIDGKLEYRFADVREMIPSVFLNEKYDLIANFAAVHREPGHSHEEYFITNIRGAENVCSFADDAGCREIVFTSSIAVYNPTESEKGEGEVPSPVSAYGSSKLAAEKIHLAWKCGGSDRRLVILRPGVVYGPCEGGNVTRMIKAVGKGYFVFTGNRKTVKASIYVKELCRVIDFCLDLSRDNNNYILVNAVSNNPHSVEKYTQVIKAVYGRNKMILDIPFRIILLVSFVISVLFKSAGRKTSINPARVRKVIKSNNINPELLIKNNYIYKYSFEKSFSDWFADYPDDWK